MIPAKLFIPTSTLNFNNIMSSESISPASFYSIRGFGYKRFEKIEPNKLNNRILLYEKYPIFNIIDKELENYPLIFEIDTKSIHEDIIKEQNGFFFSDETIYINPLNTKIYFRNYQEKISTLSKSEPSIETKMIPLYENCIELKQQESDNSNWVKSDIIDTNNDISNYISKDRRINKLKGLLYGYLLATNKSVSDDVVFLKKQVKSLRNILSAIITSPDGRATYNQDVQLKSLYKIINDKLQSVFIAPILKEKSEKFNCDFLEILKQENLFDFWLQQNNYSRFQIAQFYVSSNDKDNTFENYFKIIENLISNIEYNQRLFKTEVLKLPILQYNRIVSIPNQKEFLLKLFNEYLEEAYTSDDFVQSRYEFAKSGGKIFKEELQDRWDGSQWQLYINALLINLNEHSLFDLKKANHLTLASFAAFCQKGDSDIDKLEDYLISNEIGDFRISFGLWGIIFGFANMPKTLTNDLFFSKDLDYVSDVYKYIFNQVHNIELEGKFEEVQPIKHQVMPTPDILIPVSQNKIVEVSQNSSIDQDIKNKLKDCKLKPNQLDSISELYKNNNFIINDKFFASIKKIRGLGDKTVEKIKTVLSSDNLQFKKAIYQEIPTLFGNAKLENGMTFYDDANVWFLIETLIPKDKHMDVKTEIDWIQKVHKENGYYTKSSGWTKLDDHSNYSVIKHFENNAKNRIDPNLLKDIVAKLKEFYLQDEKQN